MNSALASEPAAISPLISITAVWAVLALAVGASRYMTIHINAIKNSNHDNRTKVFQRRVALCSFKEAKASFSRVLRSQPGVSVGFTSDFLLAIKSGAACALFAWARASFVSLFLPFAVSKAGLSESGSLFSVITVVYVFIKRPAVEGCKRFASKRRCRYRQA